MNVALLLRERVRCMPDSAAIIDERGGQPRAWSFGEFDVAAARLAALLAKEGLRPGETVLVLCPMSGELYLVLSAIFRLGMVALFADPSASRATMEAGLRGRLPRAMVGGVAAQGLRWINPWLRRIPLAFSLSSGIPGTIPLGAADRLPPLDGIADCGADTPALVTFTSGTGSRPKAAVRTHGFLRAQLRAVSACVRYAPGQVDLATLPVFVLANLAMGVTSVIPGPRRLRPGRIDARGLCDLVTRHRATRIGGSPTLLASLADHCQREALTLPGLRQIHAGGGAVPPELLDALARCAPQADIAAVYGSTEAEPIASIDAGAIEPADREATLAGRGLLAGPPVASLEVRILPDRWGEPLGTFTSAGFAATCLPPGLPGEIVVTGDHVLSGYLDPADDSETKFDVGSTRWHRTGDAGYLDERGRLWLLGRCAGAIQVGERTIYPFAVEQVARRHPGIRNATLVMVRGRRTLALEPLGRRARAADFAGLAERLPFAAIEQVRVVRRIPVDRRHSAKIDYPALRALLEGRS